MVGIPSTSLIGEIYNRLARHSPVQVQMKELMKRRFVRVEILITKYGAIMGNFFMMYFLILQFQIKNCN